MIFPLVDKSIFTFKSQKWLWIVTIVVATIIEYL